MAITQNQQKYLKERLYSIRQTKPNHYADVKLAEPEEVKRARTALTAASKVVERFRQKREVAKKKRNFAISKTHDACMRAILFGDAKAALKAIDAYEAKQF